MADVTERAVLGAKLEQAQQRIAELEHERDNARAVATILAHAYDHDSNPPSAVLDTARGYRRPDGKQ